jgi:hypothetical protein
MLFALSFLLLLPVIAVVAAPPSVTIHTPTISPSMPGPSDQVTVNVTLTPAAAVQSVTVYYTTDNWRTTNRTLTPSYNPTTQLAQAQIPPQSSGTHVEYYIVAIDSSNNRVVNDNGGNYFGYTVIAATPPNTGLWIEIALILVAVGVAVPVAFRSLRPRMAKSTSS